MQYKFYYEHNKIIYNRLNEMEIKLNNRKKIFI